jgi:CheY-like chemotaxis protein
MTDQNVILLVEDREDDVLLVQKAFAAANLNNPMQVLRSGEEAIWYLQGKGKYANRDEFPLPVLMLLDLKMNGMDGFQVLKWVRSEPDFRPLRVVVLTSSQDMADVNRAYSLGANSFLVKPLEFEHFREVSKNLKKYWLATDKGPVLPGQQPAASNFHSSSP